MSRFGGRAPEGDVEFGVIYIECEVSLEMIPVLLILLTFLPIPQSVLFLYKVRLLCPVKATIYTDERGLL